LCWDASNAALLHISGGVEAKLAPERRLRKETVCCSGCYYSPTLRNSGTDSCDEMIAYLYSYALVLISACVCISSQPQPSPSQPSLPSQPSPPSQPSKDTSRSTVGQRITHTTTDTLTDTLTDTSTTLKPPSQPSQQSPSLCEYATNTDWAPSSWSLGTVPARHPPRLLYVMC
jgi:hypothetical protein